MTITRKLKRFITKMALEKLLPKAFSRQCDTTIPRSGDRGKKVDCFTVAVDKGGDPYVLANNFADSVLTGKEWDGSSFSIDTEISIDSLLGAELTITHYYGLSEITYFGIFDFLIGRMTKWPYLKLHTRGFAEGISQYFFNQRKLVTKQRIELLKFLMERQLEDESTGIRFFQLMTELYSIKWVNHPSRDRERRKLNLYLDSLVADGEVVLDNQHYVLTGKAVASIEKYEEEERRHTEQVKMQRRAFWLTLFIALLALVQANVIKLPTIFDWSG